MPKQTKDFTYYADKAEQSMAGPWRTAGDREAAMHRAELYVRLAAASALLKPQSETEATR
jgi:hypothetical protein